MLDLCDVVLDFYPREIEKIHKRVSCGFQAIKTLWESKADIWQMAPVELGKNIGASGGS